MDASLVAFVTSATGATEVERGVRVQSLWGGYGELVRLHLVGGSAPTAILKDVRPPRGEGGLSHARKCRSYDVEVAFYRDHADGTSEACRVARPLATRVEGQRWSLLLEDLAAAGFPACRGRSARDLGPCLDWLAAFHARFLGTTPVGLWPVGTYWHLATRPDELARIADPALRAAAPELDRTLNAARFQTLVHGDAKPANFCFSADGARVAAVDFQYVGGGVGVKDVAYLLHGAVSSGEERAFLDAYFAELRAALPTRVDADALEAEWRGLYPIAARDFERFLAGW